MIKLKAMTSAEFQDYLKRATVTYAKEMVFTGNWEEEGSLARAIKEYEVLLPNNEESSNQYLYTIYHDEQPVGMIWLAKKSETRGFIYEIYIEEEFQGKGIGKKAMKEIEEIGKQLGLKKIGLHVFGHNQIARGLYEKIGYEITNIKMEKVL